MMKKGLVIGIIILFIGASMISGISRKIDFPDGVNVDDYSRGTIMNPPMEEWNKTFGEINGDDYGYSVQQILQLDINKNRKITNKNDDKLIETKTAHTV